MIVLAIAATLAAVIWSFIVFIANGMRERQSPGEIEGGVSVVLSWIGAAVIWLAWWLG